MRSDPTTIKVILADDHPIYRKGIRDSLASLAEINIVAEATNGMELWSLVQEYEPDVVLTDITMPELSGTEVIRLVKQCYPKMGAVALSMHEDLAVIKEIFAVGANGYLLKTAGIEEITAALHAARAGRSYSSPSLSPYLGDILLHDLHDLQMTGRETEIIQLLFEEKTTREISERLCLSERTVDEHRQHVQKKTGARNIVGIMKYALRHKIVRLH